MNSNQHTYQILHGNRSPERPRRTNKKDILAKKIFLHYPSQMVDYRLGQWICHFETQRQNTLFNFEKCYIPGHSHIILLLFAKIKQRHKDVLPWSWTAEKQGIPHTIHIRLLNVHISLYTYLTCCLFVCSTSFFKKKPNKNQKTTLLIFISH